MQVKLFITPEAKLPTEWKDLERDVTEQLRNFEQVSDGMLQFTVYNPQDDEEMQKSLVAKGIQPFQVQSIEKDEMGIKLIWSALTIAYKDKPEDAKAWLAKHGNPYARIGTDRQGRAGIEWGVYGVPETYVVDGDGTILLRHAGPVTQRVVDEKLRPLLEKKTSGN